MLACWHHQSNGYSSSRGLYDRWRRPGGITPSADYAQVGVRGRQYRAALHGILCQALGGSAFCSLLANDFGFFPDTRGPILTAAIFEKVIIFFLIFFGNLTRTNMMTAIAIMDGSLAIVFAAYLLGL